MRRRFLIISIFALLLLMSFFLFSRSFATRPAGPPTGYQPETLAHQMLQRIGNTLRYVERVPEAESAAKNYYQGLAKHEYRAAFQYVAHFNEITPHPPGVRATIPVTLTEQLWIDRNEYLRKQGTYIMNLEAIQCGIVHDVFPECVAQVRVMDKGVEQVIQQTVEFSEHLGDWKVSYVQSPPDFVELDKMLGGFVPYPPLIPTITPIPTPTLIPTAYPAPWEMPTPIQTVVPAYQPPVVSDYPAP